MKRKLKCLATVLLVVFLVARSILSTSFILALVWWYALSFVVRQKISLIPHLFQFPRRLRSFIFTSWTEHRISHLHTTHKFMSKDVNPTFAIYFLDGKWFFVMCCWYCWCWLRFLILFYIRFGRSVSKNRTLCTVVWQEREFLDLPLSFCSKFYFVIWVDARKDASNDSFQHNVRLDVLECEPEKQNREEKHTQIHQALWCARSIFIINSWCAIYFFELFFGIIYLSLTVCATHTLAHTSVSLGKKYLYAKSLRRNIFSQW